MIKLHIPLFILMLKRMKMTHIEDAVNNPDEYVTHTEEAENNQDENVTHTEEVENNKDKEQQAGEINFFETRTITSVVKKHKRKCIRHTLPEISKTKSNLDILESFTKKFKFTTPMSTKNPKKKTQPKLPSRKHSKLLSRKQQINIKERK